MARLNQPPDLLYTTPLNNRSLNARADNMSSSPPLHVLPLERSLQSHSNDTLPKSSSGQGSRHPSLSSADCRTLGKILQDVVSPSAILSPLEKNENLDLCDGRASSTGPNRDDDGYHSVGGEITDTGYEDQDDSMELSEGEEAVTTKQSITSLGEPASPSVSKSDRRLQASVSTHHEKEKMRYSNGRRPPATKHAKTERFGQDRTRKREVAACDAIEDAANIPDIHDPPACLLDLYCSNPDRVTMPNEIMQLDCTRLSMEKVLEQECVEQDRSEDCEEHGFFISISSGPRDQSRGLEESDLDGFDADDEQKPLQISPGISGAPHRKVSRGNLPHFEQQICSVRPKITTNNTAGLISSKPTPAVQTLEPAQVQFATTQNVPETPFTKTLSYFKQYKATKNYPPERHRTSASTEEFAKVPAEVTDIESQPSKADGDEAQPVAHDADVSTMTSALTDLEAMVKDVDLANLVLPIHQDHWFEHSEESDGAAPEGVTNEEGFSTDLPADDTQKQIILYSQHPAIINAIGMIPAAVFWATAAPVVKYTGMAVELLLDKLRDIYL